MLRSVPFTAYSIPENDDVSPLKHFLYYRSAPVEAYGSRQMNKCFFSTESSMLAESAQMHAAFLYEAKLTASHISGSILKVQYVVLVNEFESEDKDTLSFFPMTNKKI